MLKISFIAEIKTLMPVTATESKHANEERFNCYQRSNNKDHSFRVKFFLKRKLLRR